MPYSRRQFHAALSQIKTKGKAPISSTHKPAVAAKPQVQKSAASAKKAKTLSTKSTAATKSPQPAARKPQHDDPTDLPHDSHADTQDSTDETQHTPPTDEDSVQDASDSKDDTALPASAQKRLAAQQAVTANPPLADFTDEVKDAHEKHDHDGKKDSDSTTSTSDAPAEAAAVAGQLTAQAVTAVKQTSDQPDPKNSSSSSQTETAEEASVAPVASQSDASGKAHARAVQAEKKQNSDPTSPAPDPTAAQAVAQPAAGQAQENSPATPSKDAAKSLDDVLSKASGVHGLINQPATSQADSAKAATSTQGPERPEARFAEANHPTIVSEIHGKLLPSGGTMDIHLTPQDLGSVHVRVEVRDGSITATFQAADNDTAKLLSHSLTDLKSSLEAQGIAVDKLHVTHAPQDQHPSQNNTGSNRDPDRQQQQAFQQEQQRRDMMRRMWRRVMKGQDPLDLVA